MTYRVMALFNGNFINKETASLEEASDLAHLFVDSARPGEAVKIVVSGPKGTIWSYQKKATDFSIN